MQYYADVKNNEENVYVNIARSPRQLKAKYTTMPHVIFLKVKMINYIYISLQVHNKHCRMKKETNKATYTRRGTVKQDRNGSKTFLYYLFTVLPPELCASVTYFKIYLT